MKPRPKNWKTAVIDATEILESKELKDYDFGTVDIEEVQICELGVKEVDGEIRYKSVGGFSLTIDDGCDRWNERLKTTFRGGSKGYIECSKLLEAKSNRDNKCLIYR